MSVSQRERAIDLLRGWVIILMALDRNRDCLSASDFNTRDIGDVALFLTRWITHYCAPAFLFLAGVSAWLYRERNPYSLKTSAYLLLRGLWLVVLELTVVHFWWCFEVGWSVIFLQAIWITGCSMIILSGLALLPAAWVGAVGLAIIFGHNLLGHVNSQQLASFSWLWVFAHEPGSLHPTTQIELISLYTLLPWVGVMAFGYSFGPAVKQISFLPSTLFQLWGGAILGLFVLLRATNLYGDPHPWHKGADFAQSLLSFIDCEKYPASLSFLLMTLGPIIAILPLLKSLDGLLPRILITSGRVPLFFYLAHLPIVHGIAIGYCIASGHPAGWLFGGFPLRQKPETFGLPLAWIYVAWIIVLLLLYPLCKFHGSRKDLGGSWLYKLI